MERYYEPDDIRRADVIASEELGIPTLDLMEEAGTNAASAIMELCPSAMRFVVLAGHGNNGGDGFVAARDLLRAGRYVIVLKSAEDEKYKGDALANLARLYEMNSDRCAVSCSKQLGDGDIAALLSSSECVVDALLGTGSSGAPRGEIARLISFCRAPLFVVSLDIPSGIDARSGAVWAPCVKADATVTFLAPKSGMSSQPARGMCGRIITKGIGVEPGDVLRGAEPLCCLDESDIAPLKPRFERTIHKGDRGGVLILGGSLCYRGAPLLAALGALRAGAGLAVLAVPDYMVDSASLFLPEAVFVPLATENGEIVPEKAAEVVLPWAKRCGAAVFGPGIGRGSGASALTELFWAKWPKPLVVDADALHFLAGAVKQRGARKDAVITPHAGEASYLLGCEPRGVADDREGCVKALTQFAGTALLKGSGTLISDGAETRKIVTGSPALAVPGSGDVLSGVIGAFTASGMDPFGAAALGALVHAAAGTRIEAQRGADGALAREIADEIRNVLR